MQLNDQLLSQIEQALLSLTAPNTTIVRQGEKYLKEFMKNQMSILGFLTHIQRSQQVAVRQLAAVLLRMNINKHWPNLSKELQENLKATLINLLMQEVHKLPRRAIASVISRLAKHQLPNDGWPELLNCMSTCANHENEQLREVSVLLVYQQYETIGKSVQKHLDSFATLFNSGLQDSSVAVRLMTLKACGAIINYLAADNIVIKFQHLIPLMLKVIEECVSSGSDDIAVQALEVFGDMAQSPCPILKPFIEMIIVSILRISSNPDAELPTRDAALTIITNLANFKPKTISKMNVVPQIVQTLLKINMEPIEDDVDPFALDTSNNNCCGGPEDDSEENDFFDTSLTVHRMSNVCLDSIAIALPDKCIYPASVEVSMKAIMSQDYHSKRAGLNVLGIISQGCAHSLVDDVPKLLPLIVQCVECPDLDVQQHVCYTLGQWATYMKEEMGEHHELLMPVVFHLLNNGGTHFKIQSGSLYLVECVSEAMGQDLIVQYTQTLMNGLSTLVETAPSLVIKSKAMAAITSIVIANEDKIVPYFDNILPLLEKCFAVNEGENYLKLRGEALACLGFFAEYSGPNKFNPISSQSIEIATEMLKVMDPEIDEYVFSFLGCIAACLKDDFEPHIGSVVEILLEKAATEDGLDVYRKKMINEDGGEIKFSTPDDNENAVVANNGGENTGVNRKIEDAYAEEYDDAEGEVHVRIHTSLLEMQISALDCLGKILVHCFRAAMPLLQNILAVVIDITTHFHEDLRTKAVQCLQNCVLAQYELICVAHNVDPNVTPNELHDTTKELLQHIIPVILYIMSSDVDNEAAAACVECYMNFVQRLGPICFIVKGKNLIDPIMQQLLLFVQGKGNCQLYNEYEDEEDDDDDEYADHDHMLMDAVTDLIGAFAGALGPHFGKYVNPFFGHLIKFLKPTKPASDRSMVVGCFAEIVDGLKTAIAPYVSDLLQIASTAIQDPEPKVQRNACFLIGVLVTHAPENSVIFQNLDQVIMSLNPFFNIKSSGKLRNEDAALIDNACSALARIITRAHSGINMEEILPVFLRSLPLREDHEEDLPVYQCIFTLVSVQNTLICVKHKGELLRIINEVCVENSPVDNEILQQLMMLKNAI